jgi:SAM-dependent methyltransferase
MGTLSHLAPDHLAPDAGRGCRLCGCALEGPVLDLGSLPVCNHFAESRVNWPTYPLLIACCRRCGLTQLVQTPPLEAIMPRAPWIRYNEPQDHLDDLVSRLLARYRDMPKLAIGVGPFEQPLLDRLAKRGLATRTVDLLARAAAPTGRYPYLETWQALLRTDVLGETHSLGSADIVSCRYLLEHCHAPLASLKALARLLSSDGILIIEVPDSATFIAANDYCFPWEEHVSYFVEPTFRAIVEAAGLEVVDFLRYPGPLEDALVAVLQHRRTRATHSPPPAGAAVEQFAGYRNAFPLVREAAQRRIAALAGPDRAGVALVGAGHHAVMFVNTFGLGSNIAIAVDDDANKRGRFAPGIDVPIIASADLMDRHGLRACLLAVSPRTEGMVREKLAPLAARGVAFHTIYAGLPGSILAGGFQWR